MDTHSHRTGAVRLAPKDCGRRAGASIRVSMVPPGFVATGSADPARHPVGPPFTR
ncbi:hypothetical protein ACFWFI_04675 [Streptomyces sp. NPDC060209]|uniref:hypothetical protein n=1 Tax=Streptomyces sp. NPDC060209 TaxID=3347073 RepID=UPI003664A34D